MQKVGILKTSIFLAMIIGLCALTQVHAVSAYNECNENQCKYTDPSNGNWQCCSKCGDPPDCCGCGGGGGDGGGGCTCDKGDWHDKGCGDKNWPTPTPKVIPTPCIPFPFATCAPPQVGGGMSDECNWGYMYQHRTCSGCGCDDDCEHRCNFDLSCPAPITVTGVKVLEPYSGSVLPGQPQYAQPVTLENIDTLTTDPFDFGVWFSTEGLKRACSVPSLAGYDIGYSLCYDRTNCHRTFDNVNLGTEADISENSIRNNGKKTYPAYADIDWHYCPVQQPATVLNITSQNNGRVCPVNKFTLNWSAVPGAVEYELRVDDLANPWNGSLTGSCPGHMNSGDYCRNTIPVSVCNAGKCSYSVSKTLTAGHKYHLTLYSLNYCHGGWDVSSTLDFVGATLPLPPAPGSMFAQYNQDSILVSWTDDDTLPVNPWVDQEETGFRVYRKISGKKTPTPLYNIAVPDDVTVGKDVTNFNDSNGLACSTAYQYAVAAYNINNPPYISAAFPGCREGVKSSYSPPANLTCFIGGWFQCQGGDIVAGQGQLGESEPPYVTPFPHAVMDLPGEPQPTSGVLPTGVPGMLFQGQPGDFAEGLKNNPDFGNSKSWTNDTGSWVSMLDKQENSYNTMHDRAISRTKNGSAYKPAGNTIDTQGLKDDITAAVNNGNYMTFNYGTTAAEAFNVAVIEMTGPVSIGPVKIDDTPFWSGGNNKAVILVDNDSADNGGVNITDSITIDETNPTTAGFLTILSQGDINIGGLAGSTPTPAAFPYQYNIADPAYPFDITAIMYSDSTVVINKSESQIKINGTIAGKDGVFLNRDGEGPYPSEFVHYNPRMIRILRDVGLRRKIVYEQGN